MESVIKGACLDILAQFRADIENGAITNTQDVLTQLTNCMVRVQHLAEPVSPPPPAANSEEIVNLSARIMDLQGKMMHYEDALSGIRSQTSDVGKQTAKLLAEQKDNTKTILAAIENATTRAPVSTAQSAPANSDPTSSASASSAPANSNPSTTTSSTTSSPATVFFPGGPRTITIHPPGTPGYQSIIRDDRNNVIIDFRRRQPLRREGAFRGLPDESDYIRMKLVGGRGPQPAKKPVPPVPHWPDRSQESPCPPRRSCGPSEIIARQRQLAESMETDEYGRLVPAEYSSLLDAPGVSSGNSSSPSSSQESQESSSSNAENRGVSTAASSPPSSPSAGRGKKRARASDDADAEEPSTPVDEKPIASIKHETPETPLSVKREESNPPEVPSKRRKLRSSAPLKRTASTRSISRTYSMADITRGG